MIINNLINANCPDFSLFTPDTIERLIPELLKSLEAKLVEIENSGTPNWKGCVEPLEQIQDTLHRAWGVVGHLLSVANSIELREVYERLLPSIVQFELKISQSKSLFQLLLKFKELDDFKILSEPQKRLVDSWILSAKQAGVGLSGSDSERFNINQERLASSCTKFSNNILDDIKVRGIWIKNSEDLLGVPELVVRLGETKAKEILGDSYDSGWFIPVDPSIARPFLQNCRSREHRKKLMFELVRLASEGEYNNDHQISEILKLRTEQAKLVGYSSPASMYLAPKMARDSETVTKFLNDLLKIAKPKALEQCDQVRDFASAHGESDLQHWDLSYWSERLREARLGFSSEALRPYFPLDSVIKGLFTLINKLFNVSIELSETDVKTWHPDVSFYEVRDLGTGDIKAYFYLDPYVRPGSKRQGAWMNICRNGYKLDDTFGTLPVTYIVCNQMPPVDGFPSLMTFEEVTTLFHEFGHALHHFLAPLSFIGTSPIQLSEWDSIEIASQFMEEWCYEEEILKIITSHYQTGETIPAYFIDAIKKARTFLKAIHITRQLHFALTDIEIYSSNIEEALSAHNIYFEQAKKVRELPPLPEDRMLCSFGHIFSGGYSAGYYSYLWSEVLSADLFGAFKESFADLTGEDWWNKISETGAEFKEKFLTKAGSIEPSKAFKNFRGRDPMNKAFLEQYGLV